MVPHLADRPVTLVRWPDGVAGQSFFEKRCPTHAPKWMRSAAVSDDLEQCVVDDLASLVWGANMAALELHTPQARVSSPDRPDSMVFDLDPGPGATILDCCRVGLDLRDLLAELGLESVVKTSGSKGLHLAVPLHTDTTDDDTKELRARRGPAPRQARTGSGHRDHAARRARREGVRRLEPERPAQDDHLRVLAARRGRDRSCRRRSRGTR